MSDVIAALGAIQGMEIKACLDALFFGVEDEEEEEDYPEE
jgi:hypothetical protein